MASLAIVSCKTHEEKKAAFIQEVESIEEGFNQLIMEVYADSTLTDIEKNDKVNAAYEEAIAKYIEVNRKAIEKNRDNDIAGSLVYIRRTDQQGNSGICGYAFPANAAGFLSCKNRRRSKKGYAYGRRRKVPGFYH